MSDTFGIKITGSNQSSPAFQQVTRDAEKMGTTVEQASQKSSRSLKDMKESATAVGAGIGTLVGIAALSGRAFQSQEQQIRGLNRAYGESSDEIQKFSKELQDSTTYSDDAARQSAQVASTLTRSYGLTADQVQTLIARTADLASVNVTSTGAQFDLTDAVSRTAGAIRGEGEAAEALGLTLSDSAVAAAAAARGLTGWTTTMTEAEKAQFRFTLLMEQSTYAQGAAAEAAATNAGKTKQLVNDLQDMTQGFGGALGPMGEVLSVMGSLALAAPLLGAGIGKIGTALAALGGGPVAAGVAALAGASYYAYSLNQKGSGAESTTAGLLSWAAGSLGFQGVADQFGGIVKGNDLSKATNSLFYSPKGTISNQSPDQAAIMNLKNAGVLPWDFSGNMDEAAKYISGQSGAVGMTNAQYIDRKAQSSGSFTLDPITGQYVYNDTYTTLSRERSLASLPSVGYDPRQGYGSMYAISQGQANVPPGYNWALMDGVSYRDKADQTRQSMGAASVAEAPANVYANQTGDSVQTSMTAMGGQSVQIAENMTRALEAQYGAYAGLFDGIMTANDAQSAFQATQQSLSSDMSIYQGQASEWTSELNAQESAYEILQKRQEEGIALTSEQTQFMENYAQAVEVGTGAVEDSTVAAGIAAQNMLLNKDAMDTFKAGTDGVTEAILLLIETLGGVPDDVRTQITLDGAAAFHEALDAAVNHLNNVNGQTATFYINTQQTGVAIGNPNGPSIDNNENRLGGVVGYRNGGVMAQLAEAGPELLHFRNGGSAWAMDRGVYNVPKGTYVDTAPASKLKAGSGGGGIHISGPVYIYPATSDVQREFTNAIVGDWRA